MQIKPKNYTLFDRKGNVVAGFANVNVHYAREYLKYLAIEARKHATVTVKLSRYKLTLLDTSGKVTQEYNIKRI
jgi:hypothetical protein